MPCLRALFLLLVAGALAQPQDDVVFRSGVSLVRVDASVLDAGGRVVTGLTKEDFRIVDEGAAQPIVTLSFEREPLDLILLFDTSGSMKGKLLQVIRAIELGFHELKEGDRVCVMAFSRFPEEIAPFTPHLQAVNETILLKVLPLKFQDSSRPDQAADAAALRFRREPKTQRRRAVLIVTDKDTPGDAGVIRNLWNSDAVLSELMIGKEAATRTLALPATSMVERTGGMATVAGVPGEAFQQALRGIRSRYTLYYAQPAGTAGAERKVHVELTPGALQRFPGARVRARTGYLAPS